MKTLTTIIITISMIAIFSNNAFAQFEESVYVNGEEVFFHKNKDTKLNAFRVIKVEGKTYLSWVVQALKIDGTFIIYRSMDGENYEVIGLTQAVKSTSDVNLGYFFIDNYPGASGPCTYKIIHVGTDNSFFSSVPVMIRNSPMNFVNSAQ